MEMVMRVLFLALALALAPLSAAQESDPVYRYADEDAAMNAAVESARASLPRFIETFRAAPPALQTAAFMVKVAMPTPAGTQEHIWIDHLSFGENGSGAGALANEPENLEGKHRGSRVDFETAWISDWSIVAPNGMYRNFTTRVMLPRLDPAQAAGFRAALTPKPLPISWMQ
jgi:uncharacterized protein YegJ (DUF2314 family)